MNLDIYSKRRTDVISKMTTLGDGMAILFSSREVTRNADCEFPYRHDSYFYYLTGFKEPEAILILLSGKNNESILFCREKNLEKEIWDGYRYGPEEAKIKFGFNKTYPINLADDLVPKLFNNKLNLLYAISSNDNEETRVKKWLSLARSQVRSGINPPDRLIDIRSILDEMRLIKDLHEINIMKKAAQISVDAHLRAMKTSKPGLKEYHLEAEILYEFKKNGSQSPAYNTIVASGPNSCILHYSGGERELKDGDLVLIDAGCELDSYASDITRSFPANGKFTKSQQKIYEIVLEAQNAAILSVSKGNFFDDPHTNALKILSQGMLDIGLLDKNKVGNLEEVLNNKTYHKFFMHRTSHWIGMDVHDVGMYVIPNNSSNLKKSRVLMPGMTLTIEPGIYIRPSSDVPEEYWNIGIRIEDDILVTEDGCEVLSKNLPKSIPEIEALMK